MASGKSDVMMESTISASGESTASGGASTGQEVETVHCTFQLRWMSLRLVSYHEDSWNMSRSLLKTDMYLVSSETSSEVPNIERVKLGRLDRSQTTVRTAIIHAQDLNELM